MQIFFGVLIGFFIAFFALKRSINKTGYGELKVCKNTCPFYKSYITEVKEDE